MVSQLQRLDTIQANTMMRLADYQAFTPTTNLAATSAHINNGLIAEVGEVFGVYQKFYRGDFDQGEKTRRLIKELGDVMWYLSELANLENIDLETVLDINMRNLKNRQKREKLQGDGDFR